MDALRVAVVLDREGPRLGGLRLRCLDLHGLKRGDLRLDRRPLDVFRLCGLLLGSRRLRGAAAAAARARIAALEYLMMCAQSFFGL